MVSLQSAYSISQISVLAVVENWNIGIIDIGYLHYHYNTSSYIIDKICNSKEHFDKFVVAVLMKDIRYLL